MTPTSGSGRKPDDRPRADDGGLRDRAPAEVFYEATKPPRRRRLNWLLFGVRPEPVPSHFGPVEPPEKDKVGICCSGGGIRSAAFSLGALQELQEAGELRRASYLAAVSGGSYIASAISMVAKAGPGDSEEKLLDRLGPFAPGSPEEQYLRNRCSYLAPTMTDKIYLGWRVVLGLLVNLLFLSLPLVGLGLVLAGFFYAPLLSGLAGNCNEPVLYCARECVVDLPCGFWLAPIAAFTISVACGLATLLPRWKREALERFFTVWSVRMLVLSGFLALMLIAVPYLVEWVRGFETQDSSTDLALGGAARLGAGTLALIAGVIAQLSHFLSSKQATDELTRAGKFFGKLGKAARLTIAYVAATLIGPLLLFSVFALALSAGMSEARADGHVDLAVTAAGLGVLTLFGIAYYYADMTTWSLNPFYKRRLSSVFSLKRVSASSLAGNPEERDRAEAREPADPERAVGIAIERNFDDQVPISWTALQGGEGKKWPTLIVCAAANISDPGATPPGRSVTSFTFSANSVGGPLVGAVRMWELETAFESQAEAFPADRRKAEEKKGTLEEAASDVWRSARKRRRRDLTLPAAMAMSGAAISPSMGKMTRRPLRFLMALANIRLGVWVPNPRWVGEFERNERLRKLSVRPRLRYLAFELLGMNQINEKYLYVTDGGHYENLGLVELLRRGCTDVYCLDASGVGPDGGEFGALGEAIALARSELGVEIEFDPEKDESNPGKMMPDEKSNFAERDAVIGKIVYPPGEDGTPVPPGRLVYVRNTMTAQARWDVRAHHESDPRFPNNPTIDQLYTDQKFEAYRALGAGAGGRAVELMKG